MTYVQLVAVKVQPPHTSDENIEVVTEGVPEGLDILIRYVLYESCDVLQNREARERVHGRVRRGVVT